MYKYAVLAFVGLATQVEGSSVKHTVKHVGKSISHGAKQAKHAIVNAARSGVKASTEINPGSAGGGAKCPGYKNNCHGCVSNLCSWDSTTNICSESNKGHDFWIMDWFALANECTDTLNFCANPYNTAKKFTVGSSLDHAKKSIANHYTIPLAMNAKMNFSIGWNQDRKDIKTIVPQDYFCSYTFNLANANMDFAVSVNDTAGTVGTNNLWAEVQHSSKVPTTYWDQASIAKSAVKGKFLIGPANDLFTIVFSTPRATQLGEMKYNNISVEALSAVDFAKLTLQGKGGIILVVLLIVLCVVGCVVYKFFRCIGETLGCLKADDEAFKEEGGSDDFQRFQEKY